MCVAGRRQEARGRRSRGAASPPPRTCQSGTCEKAARSVHVSTSTRSVLRHVMRVMVAFSSCFCSSSSGSLTWCSSSRALARLMASASSCSYAQQTHASCPVLRQPTTCGAVHAAPSALQTNAAKRHSEGACGGVRPVGPHVWTHVRLEHLLDRQRRLAADGAGAVVRRVRQRHGAPRRRLRNNHAIPNPCLRVSSVLARRDKIRSAVLQRAREAAAHGKLPGRSHLPAGDVGVGGRRGGGGARGGVALAAGADAYAPPEGERAREPAREHIARATRCVAPCKCLPGEVIRAPDQGLHDVLEGLDRLLVARVVVDPRHGQRLRVHKGARRHPLQFPALVAS